MNFANFKIFGILLIFGSLVFKCFFFECPGCFGIVGFIGNEGIRASLQCEERTVAAECIVFVYGEFGAESDGGGVAAA